MARREGLYEVDGELVSERTPPVRWRALSYTQPMSERAPGRGKGKSMRVMFDSNTLDRAARPERFPKDPRQAEYIKVHDALAAGTLKGYFSETLVTLEAI